MKQQRASSQAPLPSVITIPSLAATLSLDSAIRAGGQTSLFSSSPPQLPTQSELRPS
eukprot:CAMPEP_0184304344 /NCGR_PEP_ID=MMETSP1049-20130417/13890_1 /TAXON_ID=77928 /ORGANISM="Proteomonas sulcata, Strain CCMP704" /LENGTH=56 /DNA_ID=CAMNT_0026616135 /DNA_START=315 /DNA_END=481 /DNA_ORIENTATION=-